MDMQSVFQVVSPIATILLGGVGAYLTWRNGGNSKPEVLRKRFLFVCDCMNRLKGDDVEPFVKEMGYLALAGTDEVSADAVEYVLTLPNMTRSLQDYLLTYELFTFSKQAEPKLFFKEMHSDASRKLYRKVLWASSLVLYVVPLIPMLGVPFKMISANVGFAATALLILGLWPSSFLLLRAFRRRVKADRLFALQK